MPRDVANRHIQRIGGAACLNFINTVSWPSLVNETLDTYDDAIGWAVSAGVISRTEQKRLLQARGGKRELAALKRVRLALHHLFTHIVVRRRSGDLRSFNRELRGALRQMHITDRLSWSLDAPVDVKTVRHRVLWDAAVLLTSDRIALLKRCANPDCGWLFLDESRRGNRRWCSMSGCGNRAKARRYYARVTGTSTGKRRSRRPARRRDQP